MKSKSKFDMSQFEVRERYGRHQKFLALFWLFFGSFATEGRWMAIMAGVLLAGGCKPGATRDATADFNVEVYRPDEAGGFSITKRPDGESTLLTVSNPWQNAAGETFRVLLLRDGESAPEGFDGAVVNGDAKRIVAMSSTHVAMLEALGEADRIVGVSGLDFICSPTVAANRGRVADVGYDTGIDFERLVSLEPDLVLLYGVDGANIIEPKLKELGLSYVYIGDYIEQSPLGKAEWMIALGELTGCRERAVEKYHALRGRYESLRDSVAGLPRPTVMLNTPYGDSWLMPSPGSYTARLIADAGGKYVVADGGAAGVTAIDAEEAYMMAYDADFWINTGNCQTMAELIAELPAFANTKLVREGKLYNNTARKVPGGGNDFYETAAVEPEALLADLIAIFHPELMKEHKLKYYKRIE